MMYVHGYQSVIRLYSNVRTFQLSKWVAAEIVLTETLKERTSVLSRWIDIAEVHRTAMIHAGLYNQSMNSLL
jgi:hypothetical protein